MPIGPFAPWNGQTTGGGQMDDGGVYTLKVVAKNGSGAAVDSQVLIRGRITGVELYEKTIGIIGLGRIGTLVAQRLAGFGTTLIGFDPYVTQARAEQIGVELVDMDQMMKRADYITIHIPKTPETTGMISTDQFAIAKPNLRIVNCSRGGIIDEAALYAALKSGRIAGAGLDVFVNEPPKDSPLLTLETLH